MPIVTPLRRGSLFFIKQSCFAFGSTVALTQSSRRRFPSLPRCLDASLPFSSITSHLHQLFNSLLNLLTNHLLIQPILKLTSLQPAYNDLFVGGGVNNKL